MSNSPKPKILCLDIETSPAKAYVWKLFDVNISLDQLIVPSAPICVAAKWVGEKDLFFFSDWNDGHDVMIHEIHRLISEADAVLTYNGDSFDIRKLTGEFVIAGLAPPPPITSIDIYKTVKKLGIQSGKLAYVGPFLKLGQKVKNAGFSLWIAVENGNEKAQKEMETYCKGDVILTEKVYEKLKPFIVNHPFLGETGSGACGTCGSHSLQSRGTRRTKAFKIQRIQCTTCGSWRDGKRMKV